MKLYLAARYNLKDAMREVRDFLTSDGHEVTAQWIDVEHESDKAITVTDEMRVEYAVMDVEDVLRADLLVAFSDPREAKFGGGGRHVEFGIALQAGKGIIVVGPKGEHIFHYWPGVEHVADVDALVERLRRMERGVHYPGREPTAGEIV